MCIASGWLDVFRSWPIFCITAHCEAEYNKTKNNRVIGRRRQRGVPEQREASRATIEETTMVYSVLVSAHVVSPEEESSKIFATATPDPWWRRQTLPPSRASIYQSIQAANHHETAATVIGATPLRQCPALENRVPDSLHYFFYHHHHYLLPRRCPTDWLAASLGDPQ